LQLSLEPIIGNGALPITDGLSINGNKILKKPMTAAVAGLSPDGWRKRYHESQDDRDYGGSKTQRDMFMINGTGSAVNNFEQSARLNHEELKILDFPSEPRHRKSRSIIQTAISLGELNQ
jgi:hypothetical protein